MQVTVIYAVAFLHGVALGIFWEGIGPKVLRAIVNHATTFYVFDLVCARALVG